MVEDILTDEHMSLHLDKSTNQVQHAQSVIASIPRAFRFKIGITRCPTWRYYTAPYSYNKFYFRQKDGVDYEHMLIIHISHSREVVAMLEHGLIVHFRIMSQDAVQTAKTIWMITCTMIPTLKTSEVGGHTLCTWHLARDCDWMAVSSMCSASSM